MADIPINARVECTDGACGTSLGLIVNPVKRQITHVVVQDKKLPGSSDRLVPVDKITDITENHIRLNCALADVAEMKPFTSTHYVKDVAPTYISTAMRPGEDEIWADPVVAYDTEYGPTVELHIPADERVIYRGMDVITGEQKVGQVDELVVDPDGQQISHVLMQKGHFWGKKEVAIPVSAIDFVGADAIWLKIDKKAIKALPTVPVKRHSG